MLTTRPRGTNDFLPGKIKEWHQLESLLRQISQLYSYDEIRTPIFEHTELFLRSVGETTDIVEKEMYTFLDRGERSLTLRPEGTASTVRAFVENKLFAEALPSKLYYLGPMFRYDRPQAGRYRQFHQYGVEVIGSADPGVDAEVIAMAVDIFNRLGIRGLVVELNSVGCPKCRPKHLEEMKDCLMPKKEHLCTTCQSRLNKNPLRILDCKNPQCQELAEDVPSIVDVLCPECEEHFQRVQEYLQAFDVNYRLQPRLVRGLDYYTMTAFEIIAEGIGAQSSICGGGRYDGLIEQCGGPAMPGIGYAIGLERIMATLEQQGIEMGASMSVQVYIATMGGQANLKGAVLAQNLRQKGISVEKDYLNRSLKAQLKSAGRLLAPFVLILGENELANNEVILRRMKDSTQTEIQLDRVEEDLLTIIKEDIRDE
jgi:histidyl-tRNA synthetase